MVLTSPIVVGYSEPFLLILVFSVIDDVWWFHWITDSDDEVRVVKSKEDKAWDSMKEGISRLQNALRNGDWSQTLDEFETVNRLVERSKMLIAQFGYPKFYIKMLAGIEDSLQVALKDKAGQKKMKPVVLRSLNQMKLKVKKHNETFQDKITDFRENPEKYEEAEVTAVAEESSDEDEGDESSEDEAEAAKSSDDDASSASEDELAKKPVKKAANKVSSMLSGYVIDAFG